MTMTASRTEPQGTPATATDAGGQIAGEGLDVGYDRDRPLVLDRLSVQVPAGRITALIGANGSGKSTLLKALARDLTPKAGRVLLDGRDVAGFPRRRMAASIGVLFQENVAPQGLTVEELVGHGRFPYRRLFESATDDDHAAVERALARAGLADLRHRPVDQLSGGQKQLAWIALALAQTTRVLLLDEPTTFLDLKHQVEVMQVIESLRGDLGLTIVMVLHDVNQAARHADHLIAMRDGKVIAQGRPGEVLTADLLRNVYEVDAEVLTASDGLPVCVVRGVAPTTGEPA